MKKKVENISRWKEITQKYFDFLDFHLQEILDEKTTEMLHINEIAERLFLSPGHLANTLKAETGHHPCYFFDKKIIAEANKLLLETELSASKIARKLTFDASNFLKFYRSLTGITPTEFRKLLIV